MKFYSSSLELFTLPTHIDLNGFKLIIKLAFERVFQYNLYCINNDLSVKVFTIIASNLQALLQFLEHKCPWVMGDLQQKFEKLTE